jgi:hypothetical protein
LLVDTALLLAFLAIPVAEKIRKRRSLAILVTVLALWSVGVQFLGARAYDVNSWNNRDGYVVKNPGPTDPHYFVTQGEVESFCRQHACSYQPVNMNVDKGRFNNRLWNIRDSQILYYLWNFEKSQLFKPLYLKQFLDQDG